MRAFRSLALGLLVCAACSRGAPTATRTPEAPRPTERAVAAIAALPTGACTGVGASPAAAEVTFAAGGRVYASAADGSGVRCILETAEGEALEWGATGDRLLAGGLVVVAATSGRVESGAESVEWSRPTGRSIVYAADGGRRLAKRPAAGGAPLDLSFLARHDEVVYHPAGTHVAVVGLDSSDQYGVFLASNTGKDPQLLALGENARKLTSPAFSHDGATLYFAADHGSRWDLHAAPVAGGELETIYSGPDPLALVTPSEFSTDRLLAFREGSCEGRTETIVRRGPREERLGAALGGRSTEPAGWLPDGRLAVLARSEGCGGRAELWIWSSPDAATLLVRDVSKAAVRTALPPPPAPPIPGAGNA